MLIFGLLLGVISAQSVQDGGTTSRKVLGSSVVTSVSVIMDAGNGSQYYVDAVGKPASKPQASDLASPIDLLNPDRYEFYTFNDSGDLVKRLMTLDEIQDIVATSGDEDPMNALPEKRVNDVVNNVQNVLKEEIKLHKNPDKTQLDTPDVSDKWSLILPAIFGNNGAEIQPPKTVVPHVTPDTVMVEPDSTETLSVSSSQKVTTVVPPITTTTAAEIGTTDLPSLLEILSQYSQLLQNSTEAPETTTVAETVTPTEATTIPNLSKFLLSSTNIYEINSELANVGTTEGAATEATTNAGILTTIQEILTQSETTSVPAAKETDAIDEFLTLSTPTIAELLTETGTLTAMLAGLTEAETTDVTTETVADATTEAVNSVTATVTEEVTTVTEVVPTVTEPVVTEVVTEKVPHIINITIVGAPRPKPAKADTSLELEYDQELAKNATNWTLVATLLPPNEAKPEELVDLVPKPLQGFGLEDSTAKLDADIYRFVQLCNELAFSFWQSVNTQNSDRSIVVSPFSATSLLAMIFLGARGSTSGEMNEILRLDDMVTFNPHLIFKNVTESIEVGPETGVQNFAITRELFSDAGKGKLLSFYKDRVKQFYDGHVEETAFKNIGDVIRRRTNLLVKKSTSGRITEFLKDSNLAARPPLAGISASLLHTDCTHGSIEGRDGEFHFVVLPSARQRRRLVPIPAVVYRTGFLAGYDPSLDATAAALGSQNHVISTIFVIPGQQGISAPGDGLARLEKRLVEGASWSSLLRSLIPRPGLELQIPRFQHRSVINATKALKNMGLKGLFSASTADLKGLNGVANELFVSEVLQINEFATCSEGGIGAKHYRDLYPNERGRMLEKFEESREYQRAFDSDPLHDLSYLALPLQLRPRQARLPEAPRLRFDRPFLYFTRHNPSGLILHIGRFNPKLLP